MAVDNSEWDGSAAMSACANSDDPAAAYAKVCAGRREGDPDLQSSWALPHHQSPSAGPNADGVRNALSRLPQTEGLTNRDAAESHLQSHLADVQASADPAPMGLDLGPVKTLDFPDEHELSVDTEKRIIGLRVLRYNEVVEHPHYGRLLFEPGAFVAEDLGPVRPDLVRLRMDHEDPPTGLGIAWRETPEAPYLEARVSKTPRGDEQLTLARDGVSRGTSPGFADIVGRPKQKLVDGKKTTVYGPASAVIREVSTTWAPTFAGDSVMYMLHKEQKGTAPMGEAQEAPTNGAVADTAPIIEAIQQGFADAKSASKMEEAADKMLGVVEQFKELQRAQFSVPRGEQPKPKIKDWFGVTLKRMAGVHVSDAELKALALDDVISTDNPGVIPDVFTPDYDDVISQDRPFLSSTRQVRPPATGRTMSLPIITTRAAAGTQYGGEKTEVTTTAPKVGFGDFPAKDIFAGADVSIQMILRADSSFLDLLDSEFAEAYALDEEQKAIAALLAGYTDSALVTRAPTSGGVMDPESPDFGTAFTNSVVASRRRPTHIWLSVNAVAAFINAKAPVTNAPLYSNLAAAFTAGGGAGGVVSGLIPVYVPALDTSGVDVIIGPSRGFVWAEDPRIRLQADNPSLAGRDILLAGTLFPAPRYADAFTTYTVAS